MNTYLEQLEALSKEKRKAMSEALLDTMYAICHQLSGYADNRPVVVSDKDEYGNPNNKSFMMDRLMCLKWLAEGAGIIELKYLDDSKYIPIGSAERSNNANEMEKEFHTISDGKYAQKLYDLFGKDRVEAELQDFLKLNFFPRCGGGIGMTRIISAMNAAGLIKT